MIGEDSVALISFRAGRMLQKGTSVTPDSRKGEVTLFETDEGLYRLIWKDRDTDQIDLDLFILPGEVTYSKIPRNGRIYLLKFKESNQRHFFWMQESSEDKDAQYEAALNRYLDPPADAAEMTDAPTLPVSTPVSVPPTPPSTPAQPILPTSPSSFPGPVRLENLQSVLSNLGLPLGSQTQPDPPDLGYITSPEAVAPILSSPDVIEQLKPLLPTDRLYNTGEDIASILRSPQFQQSVDSFAHALQTDQLAMLLVHLNLDPSIIPTCSSGVEAFLLAIQQKYQKK